MQINVGIAQLSRTLGQEQGTTIGGVAEGDGPSFADTLKDALNEVSDLQADAQDAIGMFLRGEPIELHQVQAAAEEAGIALEFLIEIRNKLTDAYRSVMSMQS